jgi:exodeoxyribonuclease-1
MAQTLYFYDLETTGINSRSGRIMQFAGQRTDMQLKPVSEPDNILIRLTDDILPDPDAIMITGITPQSTAADGITEAEFLRYFIVEICQPETIFVGYNNIRFDDEFMRFALYRNFYDPYEWAWKDKRSRWDLLDVIRMTRALRPDGITWPVASDGKPSNRLELLTKVNGLNHTNAHDALSDVNATITLARLLRNKQTKLFEYLLSMRDKKKVIELVSSGQPFLYTSGKYPNVYEKTTVVMSLGDHPGKQGILVYDLRRDPSYLSKMSAEEIAVQWQE